MESNLSISPKIKGRVFNPNLKALAEFNCMDSSEKEEYIKLEG